MKSIYAAAAVTLVSVLAAGCKPAPAPEAAPAAPAEAAPAAEAAAPAAAAELSVSKSITIAASADAVWAKVKDFNGMTAWHPAIAKSEIVEGTNGTVGAVRALTLAGDKPAVIKEKLTALDDAAKSLSYEIVEGPLPVAGYSSTIVVAAEGAGSTVTWSGKFKAAAGADDATATSTIEGVYTSGLDNLKKVAEAK